MFVSRANGKDTGTCGSDTEPCKTLAKAFGNASSGLHLHIDGTGTAQDPYDCLNMPKVIVFNTELLIEGFNTSPHLYCKSGVNIVAPSGSGLVTLSNLVLISTPLGFLDHSIAIYNCTIRDVLGLRAWSIMSRIKVRTTATITIEGTIFQNNSACLGFEAEGLSNNTQLFLVIRKTMFTRNQRDCIKAHILTPSYNFELNVECDGMVFTKNTGRFLFPSLDKTLGGNLRTITVIRNSVFSENSVSSVAYLVTLCVDATSFCILRAVNTTFVSNAGGGILCRAVYLSFKNVTMNLTLGQAVAILPKKYANIIIKDSTFARNIGSFSVVDDWQVPYTYWGINLLIQDTLFYGYHPDHALYKSETIIVTLTQVKLDDALRYYVAFDGVTVEETVDTHISVYLGGETNEGVNVLIQVTRSSFRHNGNRSIEQPSPSPICKFVISDASLDSHILFEKTHFEENVATQGIVLSTLNATFKNCYFGNNYVLHQGGDLVVWGSLTIQNTKFLHSKNDFDFKTLALITGSFISCVSISQISHHKFLLYRR